MKQHTKRLAAAAVCQAEMYEDARKASRQLMGNHQLFLTMGIPEGATVLIYD
jgi:hypothetical protein